MGKPPSINDEFIKKLTEITEANLADEQFGVSELAREMGISRAALYRKVKLKTKKSVSKFIREIRLKKAVELLKQKSGNVSEVAYEVGFGSPSYFIKCFHDHFGYSPGEVLNENNTEDLKFSKSDKLTRKRKLQFATLFIAVIAALSAFAIYQNSTKNKLEKTIAVLQFVNESPNESLTILNGLREKIFTNLELIEDINLVARKTSGKYTGENNSIKDIGKKLNANYILKGSSVTINGTTRIWLYLIETNTGTTLLSRPYQREITIGNFFEIQKEIANLITEKMDAVFTSEEEEQVAKIPTKNMAAYNLYLQGLYKQKLYELDNKKENYLEAKLLYEEAIKLDSTFADAYCQLADIYISNLIWESKATNRNMYNLYLDSGLVMVKKSMDLKGYKFYKALQINADYYLKKRDFKKALNCFEEMWLNRDKDYNYYLSKSNYCFYSADYYNTINNILLYLKLKPKTEITSQDALNNLVSEFKYTGFPKLAKIYANKLYKLHNDSIKHLELVASINLYTEDYNASKEINMKLHLRDSTNVEYIYRLMINYVYMGIYTEAFKYAQMYDKIQIKLTGKNMPSGFKGYLYQINGMEKQAIWNFNGAMEECNKLFKINLGFSEYSWVYKYQAGIYAMQGDTENAIKKLKLLTKWKTAPLLIVTQLKENPDLDNLREKPEFKEIKKDMEAKYEKTHNKIEKLLIREGIIIQ